MIPGFVRRFTHEHALVVKNQEYEIHWLAPQQCPQHGLDLTEAVLEQLRWLYAGKQIAALERFHLRHQPRYRHIELSPLCPGGPRGWAHMLPQPVRVVYSVHPASPRIPAQPPRR